VNEAPFKSYFKRKINQFRKNDSNRNHYLISANDVKHFIEEILLKSIFTKNIFEGDKEQNVNLFIWCLLYNRIEMAKVFLNLIKVFT
jgi:hypothetical protein